MPEKKSALIKTSYSFISIILGLALLAPNFAFSENDSDEEIEEATSEPVASAPNCDLSQFSVNTGEYFKISQEPEAQSFFNSTGIAFYHLKKSFVHSGEGWSYNLAEVKREEETSRFTKRVINVLKTYPKSFITKMDNVCFLLVDKLTGHGGGVAITAGSVVVVPTDSTNTIVNHEFMHAVEHTEPFSVKESADWIKANGSHAYTNSICTELFASHKFSKIKEAFLTGYAQCSHHEDRAELYAAMGYSYNELVDAIKSKPILKTKLSLLKEKLKSIDSSLTDSFWQARQLDARDGRYEICMRNSKVHEDCAGNDTRLNAHSSWN